LLCLRRLEPQADVRCGPTTTPIAQRGTKEILDFLQDRFALVSAQAIERRALEDPEPAPDTGRKGRGPGNQGNLGDVESVRLEPRAVFIVARIVSAFCRRTV